MIPPAENFPDVLARLQRFIMEHAAGLPELAKAQVLEFANHPSPVDRIVSTAEALYAVKADLSKEGREITAQLAQFAAVNGFHGMTERGQQIAQAMNRLGGFEPPAGVEWPAPGNDPEPLPRFAEPDPDAARAAPSS